jgi:hypothetical protein
VRGRGVERLLNHRPHTVEILQDIVVPESDHSKSLALQISGSARVVFWRVLTSVDLDDEAFLRTKKIDDLAVDFDLLAELKPIELSRAQDAPEFPFGIRRVLPQRPRSAGQIMPPCHDAPSPRPFGPTLSRVGERVISERPQINA